MKKLLDEGVAQKSETDHDTVAVGTPSKKTERGRRARKWQTSLNWEIIQAI